MTLRVLLFGPSGQVGSAILGKASPDVVITPVPRSEVDFADPAACAARVKAAQVDVVINAAAYTDVEGTERNPALGYRVNAVAPGVLARAAAARGLPFIHLSSNAVFSGVDDTLLDETAPTGPLQTYGRTKLAGEQQVVAAGGRAAVLRLSWVFSWHRRNFVTKVLTAAGRGRVRAVTDSRANPTAADDAADAVLAMARQGVAVPGIFHFGGGPDTSPFDAAVAVLRAVGIPRTPEPISFEEWAAMPPRPQFTRLDCSRIASAYGIEQPDWRPSICLAARGV